MTKKLAGTKAPRVLSEAETIRLTAEEMACHIASIGRTMKSLFSSRLKQEAVVTLIATKSKVPRRDIELVLNNLEQFEELWLKKKIP